jgi:nitrile hydratase beta subunit
MDGVHDMGGMHGFGPLSADRDNRPFHAEWEASGYVFALLGSQKKLFSFDGGRHAIERIPAREYMAMSYFERVLTGVASMYVEQGVVSREELERLAGGRFPLSSPIGPGQAAVREHNGFDVGAAVKVRIWPTSGHTRAPRYVHGKAGVVVGIAPKAHFPGEAAHGNPADAFVEPTYHVRFESRDLWPEVSDGSSVVVDLFQSYLAAA